MEAFRAQKSMVTYVIEDTVFDSEVNSDLRSHLRPKMAQNQEENSNYKI